MASVVGMTLVKRFTYRGDTTEEFSNTYHLSGAIPADTAAWDALRDALVTQEKTCYTNQTSVVRIYGYDSDADDATAVYVYDYLAGGGSGVSGTCAPSTLIRAPGDCAVWVRWKTSRVNANGKAIYLRKYFHDALKSSDSVADLISGTQETALQNFGVKMRDGSFLSARTIRSRLHSETLLGSSASHYITTRTLKRRGKRPGS